MKTEDIKSMTDKSKQELREEVLKDPTNTQKFHDYIDKVREENPNPRVFKGDEQGIAQFEEYLKERQSK